MCARKLIDRREKSFFSIVDFCIDLNEINVRAKDVDIQRIVALKYLSSIAVSPTIQ